MLTRNLIPGLALAALLALPPAAARAQEGAAAPQPEAVRCGIDDAACHRRAARTNQPVHFTTADGEVVTDAAGEPLTDPEAARGRLQEPGQGEWRTYDFVPGSKVLFATDFRDVPIGRFPADQLEYVRGSGQVVEKDGARVLEFTDGSRFRVVLPDTLPEDFALEFGARTGTPNLRINVFFTPQEGPLGRYEHPYLSIWRNAGIALKGNAVSSTDSYREISERIVPVRLQVEGTYAILYLGAVRAANLPVANFPRTKTIEFDVAATRNQPSVVGEIVITGGSTTPEQAFAESAAFTTRGIMFADGGDTLLPESTPVLEGMRRALEEDPDLSIAIEDHTTEDADRSRRRAEAIVRYLVDRGISADRMTAVGKGSTEPVADGATAAGRLENGRVVVRRADG